MKKIFIVLFFACMTLAAGAAGVSFTAQAPPRVEQGNKFNVTFVLSNAEGQGFKAPEIAWAHKLYGPGKSTSYSTYIVNGNKSSTSSEEYTMLYRADKPGKYTIGPASITVNGNVMKTRTLNIEVVASNGQGGGTSQQQPSRGGVSFDDPLTQDASRGVSGNDLMVRIEMSKPRVYEQQAVVCTIKLYTKYQISKFMATKQPSFDGFLIEEIDTQAALNQDEVLNGQHYKVAVLKRCILYPQQSGKLTITSGNYDVGVVQYENYRTPFGTMSQPVERQLTVQSNQSTVNVLPLPEPRPATFTGAVGKFSVKTSLKNPDLKTYKAAVYNYCIEGTGNIKYIKAPAVGFPKEFDVYDPKNNVKTSHAGGDVNGTVDIEYTFIPQYAGDFTIPASVFTYFNPETGQYEDVNVPATKLTVGKGEGTPSNHYRMQNMDIRNIKQGDMALTRTQSFWVDGVGYWLCYIVPVLLMGVLMVLYRKKLKERANVSLMRTKRANKVAQRRLKRARGFAQSGNRTEFYAELLKAMWGYFSDKLGIAVKDLNKENINAELEQYGVGEDLRAATLALLDKCEFAQYAPELASGDMNSVMQEASDVIGRLENVKPVKKVKS